MATVSRIFRLSTFSLAAGGILNLSKDITDSSRKSSENSNLELVLVQIAFRHGARTPIFQAPCKELEPVTWNAELLMGALPHTDINYELKHLSGGPKPFSKYDDCQMRKVLKGGSPVGQLTKVGQQQMYELGKKCAKLYIDDLKFVQETCNPQEIFIRTSNIQRTVDSARCVLAGMFGKEGFKGPVTMHTEDEEREVLYPNMNYCRFLKNWVKYTVAHGKDEIEGFNTRQKQIGEILNLNYKDLKPAVSVHLRDIVVAMLAHNMEIPQNILQNLTLIEEQAVQVFLVTQCGMENIRREYLSVAIGVFLEEMTDNLFKKIVGQSPYKMMLYSVHDTSVAALLLALDIFDNKWPDFAADLAFELYRDKDNCYFVRVLYQGEEKTLPGCSGPLCPLEKFKELVSKYFIDSWEDKCQETKGN
ncbi:Lysophosphatidic acid phosphatase type 6 [Stylophora pistillata]|uniref:Lysophosphatidic acid phosphatase type 6 n=2 Tax=Stylophora pistillata TaxID=50429 RepID=A0A2B4SN50_STYPI|nr:Lysophosphatidic acid phosphatase type 6 [Stylophora pistillata]